MQKLGMNVNNNNGHEIILYYRLLPVSFILVNNLLLYFDIPHKYHIINP